MKRFALTLVTLVSLLISTPAIAHKLVGAEQTNNNRSATPALRERTFKKLSEIQLLVEDKQYQPAKSKLDDLLNGRLNSYEKAQALNLRAYMQHSSEQFNSAINSYQEILALPNIPSAFRQTILYSVAQLHIAVDDYAEALHMLQHWFEQTEKPTASAYGLLAQLHYQQQQLKPAQSNIEKAIELFEKENKLPKESWWQLLLAIHYDQNQFPQMTSVLINLTTWYSKANYWTQLASIYGQQGQTDKQLYTLDAAYQKDYLTKQHQLLQLAYLLQEKGAPYRAGKILNQGLADGVIKKSRQNWQQLASAWYEAKELEKAVTAMEKSAALANDAQPYLQLAYLLLDLEQHEKSLKFAQLSLSKAQERSNLVKIHTLIGTIQNQRKLFDAAHISFNKALEISRQLEQETASLKAWLEFNKNEKRRYHLIKQYL